MELYLSGIGITKLHTTITEGRQVGPRLTRMNANAKPFFGGFFQHRANNSKACPIQKPTEC